MMRQAKSVHDSWDITGVDVGDADEATGYSYYFEDGSWLFMRSAHSFFGKLTFFTGALSSFVGEAYHFTPLGPAA